MTFSLAKILYRFYKSRFIYFVQAVDHFPTLRDEKAFITVSFVSVELDSPICRTIKLNNEEQLRARRSTLNLLPTASMQKLNKEV